MNDTLLHKSNMQMNRKKKHHNAHHPPSKRIRLNEGKFSDYCSASLRHAVETPFQTYADEGQTTPKYNHFSSQTATSSKLSHGANLNCKLLPTSDNCLPLIDPDSPCLAYREETYTKNMVCLERNRPIGQYFTSTKVNSVIRCSSLLSVVDASATIASDTEGCVSANCVHTSSSSVDTDDVVLLPSRYQDSHNSTKGSPGAYKSEPIHPYLDPSNLPNDNNAVIELKPLFPSLHPPETVTTCSARILTCRTSTAGRFFRGSVKDITLSQPSDSSHDELKAETIVKASQAVPPLQPDSTVDSNYDHKSDSDPRPVAQLDHVHASHPYSAMPNGCERLPRPICTSDTGIQPLLNRLISLDNENIGTLENCNTKSVAAVKQTKSIKYRRQAYSEKLRLRCSN